MREMKDSGVPWIGEIPKGWKPAKMKHITDSLKSGGTPSSDNPCFYNDDGVAWVAIGDMVHGEVISETKKHLSQEGIADKSLTTFSPGTLLYSIYASVGKVSILSIPATINQAILAISLNESAFQDYGKYLLMAMSDYVFSLANGNTQFNLNASIVSNLPIVIPPLNEQHRIADFLNAKCAEIDTVLEKTRTSIEDYKKLKQSVITEAVTKGIRGERPMKDSGVEWIGEIPKVWSCKKIKHCFSLRDERNYLPMDNVVLLSLYTDIGVFPHGEHEERGNKAVTVEGYKIVHKNDIVVNIILAWMGAIGISDYDGVTSPAYDVWMPRASIAPRYFHYLFRTPGIAAECYKYGRGIMLMRWRTYSDEFKQISIPNPPIEEQQEIAAYLDEKCAAIDSLITSKEALITELESYKKSLIYEYVTGKKEVPES